MAQLVKRCDCNERVCNNTNKKFHVHVGKYCVHKDKTRHKIQE